MHWPRDPPQGRLRGNRAARSEVCTAACDVAAAQVDYRPAAAATCCSDSSSRGHSKRRTCWSWSRSCRGWRSRHGSGRRRRQRARGGSGAVRGGAARAMQVLPGARASAAAAAAAAAMRQLLLDSAVLRAAAAANQEEEEGHLVSNGRFTVSEHGLTNGLPVS